VKPDGRSQGSVADREKFFARQVSVGKGVAGFCRWVSVKAGKCQGRVVAEAFGQRRLTDRMAGGAVSNHHGLHFQKKRPARGGLFCFFTL